jgi:predicted DNA-binding protein (MmcQ/YjbR family)
VSPSRPFRGLGSARGRKTRRTLERGGSGPARPLNETLGTWSGVRITPMFGRWGYFTGDRLFACFPLRDKERDLWIRLAPDDAERALRDERVRPHRRFARKGWVELDLEGPGDVALALRWLRRAYHLAADTAGEENEDG